MPGVLWKPKIREAIQHARDIILLASVHSINKRGYVQNEIKYAVEKIAEYPAGDIPVIVASSWPKAGSSR